ncbi:MAG: PCMD domain-containing protein, partial [Muribaculaceae bacterium]|nr:PCMD domain-containing protein [Muribaculaceae bacterium]
FMMPTNHKAKEGEPRKEETLKWKMVGTEITGNRFEKEGAINYVAEGHQYILTFSHNGGVAANGGVLIGLDLKDLELIKNNNTVAQPPTIQGEKGKSLNDPVLISRGKCNNDIVVEIGAVGQFKVVELSGDWISSIIGPSGEKINLAEVPDKLEPNIKVTPFHEGQTDFYNPELNLSSMKISFSKSLISSLDNGTYEVEIYVEDNGGGDNSDDKSKHRKSRVTLTIVVSEEIISIRLPENFRNPELLNVTPSSLRIPAVLMDETAEFSNPALEYRVEGTESWSRVEPATVSRAASDYEFFIEGLTPNTSYECRTVWTKAGVESYSSIQKITTADNKAQNGDFEDWSMDGKIQLLAKDNTSLYWDSGNHGSAGNAFTSTNVTTSESNIKNSGKYSAKLQSQFVGVGGSLGKFAAGNAFVGKYLATDGTDGVLGWGRPFYFRPKALKGYVKYNSATITDVADGAPDIIKGQPDKGIIYVALLNEDKDVQGDKDYPDFPVVVRTKSAKLFDKTASNVIAYGELVLHNSTEGDGMIEFTIPLYYYESMKDQKVCYLLLVCSASKGGDYFAGGRGSTMYIDDFEFVY